MACGCIVGECYICHNWIFEDELTWHQDKMKHGYCRPISAVRQENERLKKQLEDYYKWLNGERHPT